MRFKSLQKFKLCLILFIPLDKLLCAVNPSFKKLHIGENKLQIDSLDISFGVDISVNVNDVRILKASYNMNDSVHLTDICKEFISQTLAL